MSEMAEGGWMAKQVKESERNIELRDPYRTLRLERELDEAIAKLAKVRELRDSVDSFIRSPQKLGHKERAWELGNCIANIKNDLDAILQGDSK